MVKRTLDSYYLEPGHVYRSAQPVLVRTVVGSGVCVCLWDARLGIGTINHFTAPTAPVRDRGTSVYGNIATRAAIQLMREAGARGTDIVAQIIGGANHAAFGDGRVGERNVCAARECLKRYRICIHAEDTGGGMGRKVAFDTGTGHVVVMKVHQLRQEDWLHDGAA